MRSPLHLTEPVPRDMTLKATRRRALCHMAAAVGALGGCASVEQAAGDASAGAPAAEVGASEWARASRLLPSADVAWRAQVFPGKEQTLYEPARHEGRVALKATAKQSASMIRSLLRVEPGQLGRLRFSWWLPELIEEADMGDASVSDSPVRVVLAFEGDRRRFSARDAMLSELARVLTGEELPYATLNYVWCNTRSVGAVLPNRRTDRIRKLVVQSGNGGLRQWLDFDRDLRADFIHAFGEEPGALLSVGVMTDTDNTASRIQAWYGPVTRG